MKKQILMLVIGILIGAIITTGVFLTLKGKAGGNNGGRAYMGEPPTMDGNSVNRERGNFKGNMKPGSEGNLSIDSTDTGNTNTSET